jgi:hypothetical protein
VRHVNQREYVDCLQARKSSVKTCSMHLHGCAPHYTHNLFFRRSGCITIVVASLSAGRLLLMSPADSLLECMQLPAFQPV